MTTPSEPVSGPNLALTQPPPKQPRYRIRTTNKPYGGNGGRTRWLIEKRGRFLWWSYWFEVDWAYSIELARMKLEDRMTPPKPESEQFIEYFY